MVILSRSAFSSVQGWPRMARLPAPLSRGRGESGMNDAEDLLVAADSLPDDNLAALAPAAPALAWRRALWAGLGSCLAILLLQAVGQRLHQPLLLAPFGASCVLLFLAADSPLAQPRNIIGAYAIATVVGLATLWLFDGAWWSVALAVGATIALMALTHAVHPPAGAHPIVILFGASAWKVLLPVLAAGLVLLLLAARLYHQLVPAPRH